MDARHLAALLHAFTNAASRRGLLAVLAGGLLLSSPFGLDGEPTDASRSGKRRGKRKRHAKRKRRKDGTQQPPTPLLATQVAATCAVSNPPFTQIAPENSRLAQTFIALASGPLVRADLVMVKPPGAGGDFVLRLSPVEAFSNEVIVPTNEVLAEIAVAEAGVPNGTSTVSFAFTTPFSVVAGTQYALVVTRPGGGEFACSGSGSNTCPGAGFRSFDQTGSFLDLGSDLFFTTFVSS